MLVMMFMWMPTCMLALRTMSVIYHPTSSSVSTKGWYVYFFPLGGNNGVMILAEHDLSMNWRLKFWVYSVCSFWGGGGDYNNIKFEYGHGYSHVGCNLFGGGFLRCTLYI